MICPECGHKQEEYFVECARCGVILSKAIELDTNRESLKRHGQKCSDKNIKKPTRRLLFKTLKIVSVTLFPLLLISLLGAFSYWSFGSGSFAGKFRLEKLDLSYQQFLQTQYVSKIKLPETSQDIDIFYDVVPQCESIAIQAKVKEKDPDLHAIVAAFLLNDGSKPTLVENFPSPAAALAISIDWCKEPHPAWWQAMDALAISLGWLGNPQPAWWQTDAAMNGYHTSVLKFDREGGIWAFYNEDSQTIRVFSFHGQHVKISDFEQRLGKRPS